MYLHEPTGSPTELSPRSKRRTLLLCASSFRVWDCSTFTILCTLYRHVIKLKTGNVFTSSRSVCFTGIFYIYRYIHTLTPLNLLLTFYYISALSIQPNRLDVIVHPLPITMASSSMLYDTILLIRASFNALRCSAAPCYHSQNPI